ncbi:MAG: hypothetical protein V4733_03715 [Verrucomicrobiota bacterium]
MTASIAEIDVEVVVMDADTNAAPFIQATPTGLVLARDLDFEEWSAIAKSFGRALQSAAWCIGDWLIYGERKWGKQLLLEGADFDPEKPNRLPGHVFDAAIAATGLDRQTLSQYASVCRAIPREDRREELSFSHHRVLAPLPPASRAGWLQVLDSESNGMPSVKRLALSVRIAADEPRIVKDEEILDRGKQSGHDNYIPHLTRLMTVLRTTIPAMSEDQRDALKEDAQQLIDLIDAL